MVLTILLSYSCSFFFFFSGSLLLLITVENCADTSFPGIYSKKEKKVKTILAYIMLIILEFISYTYSINMGKYYSNHLKRTLPS